MVKRGADTIILASCITKGNPIGFPCPHAEQMKAAIEKKLGVTQLKSLIALIKINSMRYSNERKVNES